MNSGIELGDVDNGMGAKITSDVYIDLVISSIVKTTMNFSFNTASDVSGIESKLELTNTLKVELKAGVWAKAEVALVIVKVDGYFEMSGKGSASITFGAGLKYDDKGLMFRPLLGFDGLKADYVIKASVGLSYKKKILGGSKPKFNNDDIIVQGNFDDIIPKFDVIKSLEELFHFSADIPLI